MEWKVHKRMKQIIQMTEDKIIYTNGNQCDIQCGYRVIKTNERSPTPFLYLFCCLFSRCLKTDVPVIQDVYYHSITPSYRCIGCYTATKGV